MQDKKFCSICGKANDINNTFCNFCFSKFDDSPVDINIDSNKDSAFEKYQEGVTLWNANKFEDAIKLFEEVLKINPQCKQVWNKEKGICLHNLSRFDESVECFKKVLVYDSNDLDALIKLSVTLGETGRFSEALKYLDKILKIQPRNLNAIYFKAYNLAMLERYEESLKTYDFALSIDSHFEEALKGKETVLKILNKILLKLMMIADHVLIAEQRIQIMRNFVLIVGLS